MPDKWLYALIGLLVLFLICWYVYETRIDTREAAQKAGKTPGGQSDYEPQEGDGK